MATVAGIQGKYAVVRACSMVGLVVLYPEGWCSSFSKYIYIFFIYIYFFLYISLDGLEGDLDARVRVNSFWFRNGYAHAHALLLLSLEGIAMRSC